eukprot:5886006-Pyramimonas_sp.AAC.1
MGPPAAEASGGSESTVECDVESEKEVPTCSSVCSRGISDKMWRARSGISRTWLEPPPREARRQACDDAADDAHSRVIAAESEAELFFLDWFGQDSECGIDR